ncbi:MAG: DNA photolyase family protein [Bernardetiaceae bacterium]|jgi:deoxyribodipyrimidine photo-lyase|nr:DNA photolyase family protein [Bernardetiaceae bacterium]
MKVALFWHRRDLRLHDNTGLYHALRSGLPVLPLFIFDREILDKLSDPADARVEFLHQQITRLHTELAGLGSTLLVKHGSPEQVWPQLLQELEVAAVYANHDYEPYARERDNLIFSFLNTENIPFHTFKDQCVFEKAEVVKDDGKPYTVFTPYSRRWKLRLQQAGGPGRFPSETLGQHFLPTPPSPLPTLAQMGFTPTGRAFPAPVVADDLLRQYGAKRDQPALPGTSRLSVHLRFGTVSIRELVSRGLALSEPWLNELIWRDFYMMILWHFPHVAQRAFKPAYDGIAWRNQPQEFAAWCEGRTGYPIVDAGMRELNTTGFMHNRVRMIVASFLTKHLLIDWRWGEAYFAQKLLDFDLAANNGGWQWAAGSGCDAAPYFRVFNPTLQAQKFDPELRYVRRWVPEFSSLSYPRPLVPHELARERALATYKAGLGQVAVSEGE